MGHPKALITAKHYSGTFCENFKTFKQINVHIIDKKFTNSFKGRIRPADRSSYIPGREAICTQNAGGSVSPIFRETLIP